MAALRLRLVKAPQEAPWREMVLEPPGEYILGRDPRVHIPVPDKYVSRRHLRIFYKNGKWLIEDLGSRNGTLLNDKQIQGQGPVEAPQQGEIVVGLSVIQLELLPGEGEEKQKSQEEEESSGEEKG